MQYSPRMRDLLARGAGQITLHERAVETSAKTFGPRVFARTVVEVSNYCRENCCFWGMRGDNSALARTRACHDEVAELFIHYRPAIVTDVETTLNCIAILRLMRPGWTILAVSALNLAQAFGGYHHGLRAGSHLVTVNLTRPALQRDYILYKRDPFIMDERRVLDASAPEGLTPSTQSPAGFCRKGVVNEDIEQAAAMAT